LPGARKLSESLQTLSSQQGVGQCRRHAQIARARHQGLGPLRHVAPIRILRGFDRISNDLLRPALLGAVERHEFSVVFKIRPAGIAVRKRRRNLHGINHGAALRRRVSLEFIPARWPGAVERPIW